jgi:hypothetical protein
VPVVLPLRHSGLGCQFKIRSSQISRAALHVARLRCGSSLRQDFVTGVGLCVKASRTLIGRPGDRGSIAGRGERIFPVASVQTGSGAHPASCRIGTGGKARPGRDADHSLPSSAEVKND